MRHCSCSLWRCSKSFVRTRSRLSAPWNGSTSSPCQLKPSFATPRNSSWCTLGFAHTSLRIRSSLSMACSADRLTSHRTSAYCTRVVGGTRCSRLRLICGIHSLPQSCRYRLHGCGQPLRSPARSMRLHRAKRSCSLTEPPVLSAVSNWCGHRKYHTTVLRPCSTASAQCSESLSRSVVSLTNAVYISNSPASVGYSPYSPSRRSRCKPSLVTE
mmetsp:Transcript_67036/g.185641  ORF Transcript_67036/g.185641 Transcript_67036/m.185641 type:complete len:214 (-) Transcript_67036:76-717(-)